MTGDLMTESIQIEAKVEDEIWITREIDQTLIIVTEIEKEVVGGNAKMITEMNRVEIDTEIIVATEEETENESEIVTWMAIAGIMIAEIEIVIPRHRRERTTRWDDGYEEHRERKREAREKEKRSEREKEAEFKSDNEPTSVIMLRGLRDEIKEDDILEELYSAEVAFKDVRIVRNKIGYTRGFGFVEFDTVESAKQWMDHIKGRLICQGFSIGADYSRPKNAQDKDWNCPKCGTQNFSSRRRTTCFSCGTPKEVSGDDKESSNPPCKVLILKGLDVLTNEETVRTMLSSITTLPIYDIRLIRDKLTSTSRGFCFVELASIEDATNFLEELSSMNPPFEIDGRIINTLYAKNSEPAPASKP
ncbi:hypothetical protein QZH41_001067, partial [Actinostola sp. cb2023]